MALAAPDLRGRHQSIIHREDSHDQQPQLSLLATAKGFNVYSHPGTSYGPGEGH